MSTGNACEMLSDEMMWSIVRTRNRHANKLFIYAVKTTGVYCRPGCSSRLPRRENVVFFSNGREASIAGFRPCRRCRPDIADPDDDQTRTIARACMLMEETPEPPSLATLAQRLDYSPSHFHRLFKRIVGVTPKAFADARRMNRVKANLRRGSTVTETIYRSGYSANSRFYEETSRALGMTPSEYQKGAAGLTIRAAVASSYLGLVLVAATEKGVCSIDLGDDENKLVEQLRKRFPKARITAEDAEFNDWIAQVVAHLDTPRRSPTLPLDIQGTAFQRRVWEALRSIPPGTTRTYSQVAAKLGQPTAARAVARACAANPLAVAIPCHRVVRRDGRLGGYRWGLKRKQMLLEKEATRDKPTPQ